MPGSAGGLGGVGVGGVGFGSTGLVGVGFGGAGSLLPGPGLGLLVGSTSSMSSSSSGSPLLDLSL